ncbi:hypothetical protein BK809_0000528 [Diplodia seriata]|uniref:C2H2-type domain-containing protein n=1 Tax=Diplodia seriata TaxID=420778 RepID=A0A1S8BHS3_9PEZI|nr:hypothetical protein BK809_0000528 [Diplodia seriata]
MIKEMKEIHNFHARSNASSHLMPSFHEKRNGRYHCLFQPCTKSFTREADLFRHQNTCHLGSTTFWCSSTGCNRSRSHPSGRPFPRKDKRNDHERKVHCGVLSLD